MRRRNLLGSVVLAIVAYTSAYAVVPQTTAEPYRLTGFRSAHFGMTPDAVRDAVYRDFGADATVGPVAGSTALRLVLVRLDPAPGTASINYLFDGAGRLTAINIGWSSAPNPTADERQAMLNGAQRLQRYFATQPQKPPVVSKGGVLPTGGLLLYHAEDADGDTVELTAIGLPYATSQGTNSMPQQGPAALRLGYFSPLKN